MLKKQVTNNTSTYDAVFQQFIDIDNYIVFSRDNNLHFVAQQVIYRYLNQHFNAYHWYDIQQESTV